MYCMLHGRRADSPFVTTMHMRTRPTGQRMPWERITVALAAAALLAWALGFGTGLIIRLAGGH
jgi:hypothetical protein